MRGEPKPDPVTLLIGTPDPQSSTSLATERRSPAFATPALAFRELRHPAATGYRYRDIQDTDRING